MDTDTTPVPNEAFQIGMEVVTLATTVMRVAEPLDAEVVCELEKGLCCIVKERGVSEGGRRLCVRIPERGVEGWVSCATKSGKKMFKIVESGSKMEDNLKEKLPKQGKSKSKLGKSKSKVHADDDALSGVAEHESVKEDEIPPPKLRKSKVKHCTDNSGSLNCTVQDGLGDKGETSEGVGFVREKVLEEQLPSPKIADNGSLNRMVQDGLEDRGEISEGVGFVRDKVVEEQLPSPKIGDNGSLNCMVQDGLEDKGETSEGVGFVRDKALEEQLPSPKIGEFKADIVNGAGENEEIQELTPKCGKSKSKQLNEGEMNLDSPNRAFSVGQNLVLISPTIMRESEDTQSPDVKVLAKGELCILLEHGIAKGGRRIFVDVSGVQGWISCEGRSGQKFVEVVSMGSEAAVTEDTSCIEHGINGNESPEQHEDVPPDFQAEVVVSPNEPVNGVLQLERQWTNNSNEDQKGFLVRSQSAPDETYKDLLLREHDTYEDQEGFKISPPENWCTRNDEVLNSRLVCEDDEYFLSGRCDNFLVDQNLHMSSSSLKKERRAPTIPNFTTGDWDYVCVDPRGLRTRTHPDYSSKNKQGSELHLGEMVRIVERGSRDNIDWLLLADGRGWAFVRTNRRRMSEVLYNDISNQSKRLVINPALPQPVPLLPTPSDNIKIGTLVAGELLQLVNKAQVYTETRSRDVRKTYLQVIGQGSKKGWIGELDSRFRELALEYVHDFITPDCPLCWISVLPGSSVTTTTHPCIHGDAVGKLAPGDFLQVVEKFSTSTTRFFKIANSQTWVCEKPKGTMVVDLVERKAHWWLYLCKEGDIMIRNTPTRAKNQNTNRTLRNRQRCLASESVVLRGGDEFVFLNYPHHGWVPLKKTNGQIKLERVEPISVGTLTLGCSNFPDPQNSGNSAS